MRTQCSAIYTSWQRPRHRQSAEASAPVVSFVVGSASVGASVLSAACFTSATGSASAAGLVFTLANSIPVYGMMKKMSPKGKIINTAWLVPATAALGDHLGFTAGVMPSAIAPMVISKLVAGVLAVLLTLLICKNTDVEDKMSAEIAAKEGNAGEEPAVA